MCPKVFSELIEGYFGPIITAQNYVKKGEKETDEAAKKVYARKEIKRLFDLDCFMVVGIKRAVKGVRRPLYPAARDRHIQYPIAAKPPLFLMATESLQEIRTYLNENSDKAHLVRDALREILPLKSKRKKS